MVRIHSPAPPTGLHHSQELKKYFLTIFLLPYFEMKSHDQAHTYGPNNSNFSGSSKKNSTQKSKPIIEEVSLSEAIENFQLMAKVEGQADKTLELYDYVFRRILGFLPEERLVTEIKPKDLREYLASLLDDGLKDTSVAIHFRHLRAFFNWLVDENYLKEAPTDNINEPKTPNKFPRVLNSEQIQKLLQAAKDRHGDWASYRNYAMLVVFTEMGLRLNELVTALLDDLDMKNRSLKVHGKGAKDRKVYFGKKLSAL